MPGGSCELGQRRNGRARQRDGRDSSVTTGCDNGTDRDNGTGLSSHARRPGRGAFPLGGDAPVSVVARKIIAFVAGFDGNLYMLWNVWKV